MRARPRIWPSMRRRRFRFEDLISGSTERALRDALLEISHPQSAFTGLTALCLGIAHIPLGGILEETGVRVKCSVARGRPTTRYGARRGYLSRREMRLTL